VPGGPSQTQPGWRQFVGKICDEAVIVQLPDFVVVLEVVVVEVVVGGVVVVLLVVVVVVVVVVGGGVVVVVVVGGGVDVVVVVPVGWPPGPVYGGAEVGSDGLGKQVATWRPWVREFKASVPIWSTNVGGTAPTNALKL
jgi:hypothetical protein